MSELRANTAASILIGPIVDSVAATEEAGETIAYTDVLLSKNGSDLAAKNETTAATFRDHGCYTTPVDATDTNTPGRLSVVIFMAGTMIYRENYDVLSEQAYDAKYAGQGGFIGQIAAYAADTPSAGIMRITIADPGLSEAADDQLIGCIFNILDRSTREVLASRVVGDFDDTNNYVFIDDADFTPTTSMDYQVLWAPPGSASYATEVGLNSTALAAVQDECDTSIVNAALATASDLSAVDANVDSILADTNELQSDDTPGALAALDTLIDSIIAAVITNAAGVDIAADIIALKAETAAILADSDELQTDWTDGGRLDLIQDAILDDTDLIDDGTSGLAKIATDVAAVLIDTNELQTDDTPAAIAALPTAAENRAEMDSNSTQLAAIVEDTGTTLPATLSGLATAANLAVTDAVADAIKVKTDQMVFTKANELDTNPQSMAGITMTGTTPIDEA